MADVLVVNKDSRTVRVPAGFVLGVESDEDTNKVTMKVPRWVGNDGDIDLSLFSLRIVYVNANGIKGTHSIADVAAWTSQDDTEFPDAKAGGQFLKVVWPLSRLATAGRGKTFFSLCAITQSAAGDTINEWNTEICGLTVKQGLEIDDSDLTQEAESVINQLLAEMNASASDAARSAKESASSATASSKSAEEAKASANAAENYKNAAEVSEKSAGASKTAAAASEKAAVEAKAAAEASKTKAAASEAAAKASEAAAAASEKAAVEAKTAAEASKAKAAASETAAKASETAAAASANLAKAAANKVRYAIGIDEEGYISLFHYEET
jgi:hypothetical protein